MCIRDRDRCPRAFGRLVVGRSAGGVGLPRIVVHHTGRFGGECVFYYSVDVVGGRGLRHVDWVCLTNRI